MSDTALNGTIEVVRGRLTDHRAAQLVAFWTGSGVLDEPAARDRLQDVVCVLLDEAGEVAGVNSVGRADVALLGGRPFWLYRSLLRAGTGPAGPALIRTAFRALDVEFDPDAGGPIGLCLLLDAAQARERPEAEWSDPRMLYAGYLADGRQVRVAYFTGARVGVRAVSGG
jgi:hypothetical protein